MRQPIWLSIEEVIEANRDVVLRTGEPFLILNRGLLESAVASPANRYHYGGERDIVTLAVACCFRSPAIMPSSKETREPRL
jgi:prophage maintenance system killer protein